MFHKQHVQGAVGFLISLQLQIYQGIFSENIFQSLKILQNYGHESVALLFWPTLYIRRTNKRLVSRTSAGFWLEGQCPLAA